MTISQKVNFMLVNRASGQTILAEFLLPLANLSLYSWWELMNVHYGETQSENLISPHLGLLVFLHQHQNQSVETKVSNPMKSNV